MKSIEARFKSLRSDWNEYWFPESSGLNLAICRIVVITACLTLFFPPLQTQLELLEYNDGFLAAPKIQQFLNDLWGEELWRTPQLFFSIHWVTIAAGWLTVVGLFTRFSSCVFALGFLVLVTHRWSYGSTLEIGPIKPVDTANAIFFLLLPFSPCGRRLSLDAWFAMRQEKQQRMTTPYAMWVLKLTGIVLGLIYLNAGWSKLINGVVWLNGYAVCKMNFVRGTMLDLPTAVWISQHINICRLISVMVGFELGFIAGVSRRTTLPFWLFAGVCFHVFTYFIYLNHFHFLSWVVLYLVFIDFESLRQARPISVVPDA